MKNILPFVSPEGGAPYDLTNRGLQISLLVGKVRPKHFQKLPRGPNRIDSVECDRNFTEKQCPLAPENNDGAVRIEATGGNNTQLAHLDERITHGSLEEEDTIQIGVLNCHIAHDFFNVVSIPLRHLGGDSYEREVDIPPGIMPESSTQQFSRKTIYIRTRDVSFCQNVNYFRGHGLLIHSWPYPYHLDKVWPPEFWREKDRTLLRYRPPRFKDNCSASILFTDGIESGLPFVVTLGVEVGPEFEDDNEYPPKSLARGWRNVRVVSSPQISLQKIHNDLGYIPVKATDRARLDDRTQIYVDVKPAITLGQEMFLVEFQVLKGANTS